MAFAVKAFIFDGLRSQSRCRCLQENQNIVGIKVVDLLAFTVKAIANPGLKYCR